MITLDQFKKMIPTNSAAAEWYQIASDLFPKYGIITDNRIAGFMAQAAHESGDFKVLQENLNYSADGLLKTFGKYFTAATAKEYARKPELIANRVYDDANRKNKLGNTQPGDGWRFRGRGVFQLTGRWNYEKFGKTIGKTAEEAAAYLETKQGAFESALWYWTVNNLNKFADANDIKGMSKAKQPQYQNLKSECYYTLAQYIEENKLTIFVNDKKEQIVRELEMIKRHRADVDGKLQVTPKDQIKLREGISPDIADAIMMRMFFELNKSYGQYYVG